MIDLREDDFTLSIYVQKFAHLSPPSPHLQERMEYSSRHSVKNDESSVQEKPDWLKSKPQIISDNDSLDKAKGALIGLAVGDAVGTTLEFLPRDRVTIIDMIGGGVFKLKPGEWTDDTSMALCLAETYLETKKMDVSIFRRNLLRWYRYGENSSNGRCFDIGNTTKTALEEYAKKGNDWFGNSSPESAGNAPVIRQAPVSIFNRKSLYKNLIESKQQCVATHGAAESINSCQFLSLILHYLINGCSKENTFSPHVWPCTLRVLLINAGEYKQKKRDQIRSSGYVIDTLEAAMWAVWNTDNFRDAVLLAANLADDADSVAATAGQIAGALYGYSGIPQEWKNKLVQHEHIVRIASELFDRAPEDTFL